MALIKLSEDVFIDPQEIVSIKRHTICKKDTLPSNTHSEIYFDGSSLILKNGQKIFVRGVLPQEILKILETAGPL